MNNQLTLQTLQLCQEFDKIKKKKSKHSKFRGLKKAFLRQPIESSTALS